MVSNREQLLLLFRCLGCGVWLGLFWEIVVLVRRAKHHRLLRFAADVLGGAVSGLWLFLFALAANAGEMRPVMLLTVGIGMAVTHLTIGRWISPLQRWLKRIFTPFHRFWHIC